MSDLTVIPGWQPDGGFPDELHVVPLDEFVVVDEPGADALLGDPGEALIPENGDVMCYGDGGAGKTTLMIDLAFHLAAGDDWLGVTVGRPLRVLLVENEGPRPLFRAKLRRKRDGWAGSPLRDDVHVVEAPWAQLRFDDELCRETLAGVIRRLEVDVVVCGPVTRSGMNDAGTLQEVRDFMLLVAEARRLAGRHVTFILVHHEGKGGKVSGAWEGAGDTLLHVQAQGHGRTRLHVQKARWSSAHHATTLNLVWADGETFQVDEEAGLDDETLAEMIVAYVAEHPGTGWRKVAGATPGVNDHRRMNVRDGLFAAGRLVNVIKEDGAEVALDHCPERRPARLYRAADPTISHLLPGSAAAGQQTAAAGGEGEELLLLPAARPIRAAGQQQQHARPPQPPEGDA